jgi:hypothetical protein
MLKQQQELADNVLPQWTHKVVEFRQLFNESPVILIPTHRFGCSPAQHTILLLRMDMSTPVLRTNDAEEVAQVAHVIGISSGHSKTAC